MPAASTPSTVRRAGAPKAKGTVRAKSGCYTCRIRRKKCDEQPDDAGRCKTCVRLRLECLGFGAKRPEWLRENRNVLDLREKIKTFLASQGMIKGHSGSGPRTNEHEPPMLRLGDDYSSSSESPSTPTLSLSSGDGLRPLHHTSSMRETWMAPVESYNSSGLHYSPQQMRPDSPYESSNQSIHDISPYHQISTIAHNSTNSLVPFSPALGSSFGPSYNQTYLEDFFTDQDPPTPVLFAEIPRYPETFSQSDGWDVLVKHYMDEVVDIQYLLADSDVHNIIYDMVSSYHHTRNAAHVLAAVHLNRRPGLQRVDTRELVSGLRELLNRPKYQVGDAMAALHLVSSVLFDGGQGDWAEWLRIACVFVNCFLFQPRYHGPEDALLNCPENVAFVIKTTIWFDVLASVTTQEPPQLLTAIRELFDPSRSAIQDPSSSLHSQYSMMSPMGCENHIVWALAETSWLSTWKQDQLSRGCLSIPDLVSRATDIERALSQPTINHPNLVESNYCRCLTSEIFRSSTILYLHSVVSGDYPYVPDIMRSVEDAIRSISKVPGSLIRESVQSISRSVVRSTVFGIFICGALTNEAKHQKILLDHLDREVAESVGNCRPIRNLLQEIWNSRVCRTSPVEWRNVLKRTTMLLV